jgi:hypothetical protein
MSKSDHGLRRHDAQRDFRPVSTGELPVTLTRPDKSLILLQKTHISIFVRSFYRILIARFNRHGGRDLPVY